MKSIFTLFLNSDQFKLGLTGKSSAFYFRFLKGFRHRRIWLWRELSGNEI